MEIFDFFNKSKSKKCGLLMYLVPLNLYFVKFRFFCNHSCKSLGVCLWRCTSMKCLLFDLTGPLLHMYIFILNHSIGVTVVCLSLLPCCSNLKSSVSFNAFPSTIVLHLTLLRSYYIAIAAALCLKAKNVSSDQVFIHMLTLPPIRDIANHKQDT